jgi:hypothetical protein
MPARWSIVEFPGGGAYEDSSNNKRFWLLNSLQRFFVASENLEGT